MTPQESVDCSRQRSLYKDKLDQKLLHRPKPEELVKSGILKRKYTLPLSLIITTDHPA